MVSATPGYMSFGLMREGQEIARTVRIENHDADFVMPEPKVSFKGAMGDFEHPDSVSIQLVPLEGADGYELTLTMRAPDAIGTIRGKVVVEVGHPTKPTLELPFTAVVRRLSPAAGQRPVPPTPTPTPASESRKENDPGEKEGR